MFYVNIKSDVKVLNVAHTRLKDKNGGVMGFQLNRTNSSRKVFWVALYYVKKNRESNKGLTNKKLQKLLYYTQAWHLVFYNEPAFDEPIQAWVHGPAIPRVYGVFKEYAMNDISDIEIDDTGMNKNLSETDKTFYDEIWNLYGGFDAAYLEMLTHREEPWQKARIGLQSFEASTSEITRSAIKAYYEKRLQEAAAEA